MLTLLAVTMAALVQPDLSRIEQAAAGEVRRVLKVSGDLLFEPRVLDPEKGAFVELRTPGEAAILAKIANARLADFDEQLQCGEPIGACPLRDGLTIFYLTRPMVVGATASIWIKSRRPVDNPRSKSGAADVEILLRQVGDEWWVIGTGQMRATRRPSGPGTEPSR